MSKEYGAQLKTRIAATRDVVVEKMRLGGTEIFKPEERAHERKKNGHSIDLSDRQKAAIYAFFALDEKKENFKYEHRIDVAKALGPVDKKQESKPERKVLLTGNLHNLVSAIWVKLERDYNKPSEERQPLLKQFIKWMSEQSPVYEHATLNELELVLRRRILFAELRKRTGLRSEIKKKAASESSLKSNSQLTPDETNFLADILLSKRNMCRLDLSYREQQELVTIKAGMEERTIGDKKVKHLRDITIALIAKFKKFAGDPSFTPSDSILEFLLKKVGTTEKLLRLFTSVMPVPRDLATDEDCKRIMARRGV